MKEWTESDSAAMFRQSSETSTEDERTAAVDNSEEARRRRRFPFEAGKSGAGDQPGGRQSPDED